MGKELFKKLAVSEEESKSVAVKKDKELKDIEVVSAIGFNLDNRISDKDEETNQNAYEEEKARNPLFNRLQTTKGYLIRNVGKKTIKDIAIAKYVEKDGVYIGVEEKVDLAPSKIMCIPTKWLVLLALRPEYNLEFSNGKFIKRFNQMALQKEDWDAVMSSMTFKCNDDWKEICEADGFFYPIGYKITNREGKELGWCIEDGKEYYENYKERFGYLCNPIQKGKAGRNEVKITLKSAEIIGALMLLQKAKKRNEGK